MVKMDDVYKYEGKMVLVIGGTKSTSICAIEWMKGYYHLEG